jgi:hypothetical protein
MARSNDRTLAALPPVAAPIAAPAAAPLAFSPAFFCGWAFVDDGAGVDFAGGVCANAGGNIALVTAIAVTNPIALNEYFTYGLLLGLLSSDPQHPLWACSPARPTTYIHYDALGCINPI